MTGGTQLIVVRHGQTEWNAEGRFQGQSDPDLDGAGWAQANGAAAAVIALAGGGGWQDLSVVSSDLRRARSTAGLIAAALEVPLTVDIRLREIDLGRWEGLLDHEVARLYPAEWAEWHANRLVRRGGGEDPAVVGRRVAEAVRERLGSADTGLGTVVVVGHGRPLQMGMALLACEGFVDLEGPAPHLANGEVFLLPMPVAA